MQNEQKKRIEEKAYRMWFSAMLGTRLIAESGLSASWATGICRLTIELIECSRRFGDMTLLYLLLSKFCLSIRGIRALWERFRNDIRLSFNAPFHGCCGWWWWCWYCCWLFERIPWDELFNNSNLAFITILFNFTACCGCCTISCSDVMAFFGWRILENTRELNNCSVAFGLRGRIGGDRSISFDLMYDLRDVDPAKLFRRLAALNLFSDSFSRCKFCVKRNM